LICYFDIETLACTDEQAIMDMSVTITQETTKELDAVSAPSNYKDQEKIDAYITGKRESIKKESDIKLADKIAKTSFDGALGSIACISWAFDDGVIYHSMPDDTEAEVINRFYDSIRDTVKVNYHGGSTSQSLTFCGHNIAGFDLPFLKHRSIILGIKPPPDMIKAMTAKPWDSCIADTMLLWSTDSQKRASMEKLCRAFGIEGKGAFDGSQVNTEWTTGSRSKVIEYCNDDIVRTRKLYKRMMWL
jgi:hypothetical protein